MKEKCCFVPCEHDAEYVFGDHLDPYGISYVCEEHKNVFEYDYCEKLEEE